MKKYTLLFLLLFITWGCNDEDFLNRDPKDVLLDEQVWQDKGLVFSVLADLYDRYPDYQTIENWVEFTNFDEAFASANPDYGRHKNQNYGYGDWSYWDYGYMRELNLFIQKCEAAEKLDPADRSRFTAEAHFLRAAVYFEMAKRMGGVPLILEPLEYDFSGDPTYLQYPRAKEYEIYDFVLNELETISTQLPDDPNIKSRATKGLALAMKARAALYAASIARYGVNTPQVSLPGEEVGIPAGKAVAYYETALDAAQRLITSGKYSLYNQKPDLAENFASLFYDKENNPEVIFVEDYKLKSGHVHGWTISNQPRYQAEEQQGGRLNPSLNLVQSFEKLDNTFAPLTATDSKGFLLGANNQVAYFNNPQDLFIGRDARLWGTVILPGTQFKNKEVDIWGGYMLANGSVVTADVLGGKKKLSVQGELQQVVGFSGPIDNLEFSAQTGFYVRKYLDPAKGSGQLGTQSDVWWIRYRYAEVLLNAAEAAFALEKFDLAATYINQVRERAGFTIPLTADQITFDRIVHERKVELAFEGHQLWDMKRWRIAHLVWNGVSTDLTSNPGKATESSTRPFGLWPYKVYNPGSPTDGKWVFKKIVPGPVTNADWFRMGNYYSQINNDILNNNPKIVKNPNQN
ncbi:RagB/SusD family nutrient uptake outer membrane protein [Cytophagaceae bacterium DM2B3-1]|uniref:RagB/SusD family nutrient uptake outer membrane protein n=1 Tax=Xanthocytophaga flava TaxID=3048013 RepID=A0AAE3UCH0_9BACT|nr:RagB/SusD family nutrient uptake outer membrane protein [Xanthocytophaga flavus]MDJ1485478.1 RagB/SusD family nutrient uptake outer membrane protein [Xanthocytophaga flavus]MDJ1495324.1 RagB/SusD family nutrient uptake outer membrane protein [Xanthocytophaga flavus]